MHAASRFALGLAFLCLASAQVIAGGSGLNVVVVANAASSNSLELANYYCEKRGVPPQNVLRINWTGSKVDWTKADFESFLRLPLNSLLASRNLSNQVDFVLLSMDIPYRVNLSTGSGATSGINSTTAALFYGFKPDGCNLPNCPAGIVSCNLPNPSSNAYAGSESIFRQTPPISASSNSWLVMMLTFSNLAKAKAIVDLGVASDSSFPTQTTYLAKSYDLFRNVRYVEFDDAIFNTRLYGGYSLNSTNTYTSANLPILLGFQNGVSSYNLYQTAFVPGAMVDNLTSYGGLLFETSGHTGVMDFLNAGATASYGTVVEPCNYLEKFPTSMNYFYQARGFTIAESYYQSLTNPYQGILVGEPLAAPFAHPAAGQWLGLPTAAPLSGTTNLTLTLDAADAAHPVQQVDLFVDGQLSHTLTNIPPRTNNILHVTLNGYPTNYPVPANATIKSVVSNLVLRLNRNTYSNATKVAAFAHGDRIELQNLDPDVPGANVTVSVSNSIGTAAVLTSFLSASQPQFFDTLAYGRREFTIAGNLVLGDYLSLSVTKTNGGGVIVTATNLNSGATFSDFVQGFVNSINNHAGLQGDDGLIVEDLLFSATALGEPLAVFNLRARSLGVKASEIEAWLTGSFTITPLTQSRIAENINDLRARNNLFLTAGLTNLPLTFAFNTVTQVDGFHELTAVAYEGSHVRTQCRFSQIVRITNSPLAATLSCLLCDTNTALEATLQFQVAANTNTISRIELFSTGGSWGVVSNQPTAAFSLAATNLGLGLHPFYAIVMRSDGKLYRTETKWIRLNAGDAPFFVNIAGGAPTLSWPATAGRRYEILSAVGVTNALAVRDAVIPTNSPGRWSETNSAASNRIYRVRTAP